MHLQHQISTASRFTLDCRIQGHLGWQLQGKRLPGKDPGQFLALINSIASIPGVAATLELPSKLDIVTVQWLYSSKP